MDEGGRDVAPLTAVENADLPEPPEFGTVEHVCADDGTELALAFSVTVTHGRAAIEWTASWEGGERSGLTDVLSDHHGAVIYDPKPTINGEETTGSKLPPEKLEALRADLAAAERYVERAREAAADARRTDPLELVVGEHVARSGGELTATRVLTPSKAEEAFGRSQWTGAERALMAAVEDELGTTGGFPNADGPFAESAIGEAFALREVVGRIDGVAGEDVPEADAER
ncbi:hypothetical protein [Saliphagus infecundisoli]|uniref:Uncharacterized protein n=1 Tax=Saliphagus infecundisoli TaxID=1849069 RepID=A0ABD5QEF3_9EURY|nr:hypothetical protein [Saliphagus infecundisoli]